MLISFFIYKTHIAIGVYCSDDLKDQLVTEANDLKKLIKESMDKLTEKGLTEEVNNLKRFDRDVTVVERHIESAGNDPIATKSASIVLGGLSKKIHDEVKRCEELLKHSDS